MDLGHLDVVALLEQQTAQQLGGQQASLTADADDHNIFGFHSLSLLVGIQCAGLAQLLADAAADAEGVVDFCLAADDADGGAADAHAALAADALVLIHLDGLVVLDILEQGAGTAGDDDGA